MATARVVTALLSTALCASGCGPASAPPTDAATVDALAPTHGTNLPGPGSPGPFLEAASSPVPARQVRAVPTPVSSQGAGTPTLAQAVRATHPGAEADVLSWLPQERDARIERSYVVRGSDFVDVWVDAPAYESEQLLFRDPAGGTTALAGEVAALALDEAPVIVVEASTYGIGLHHPWPAFAQGEDRLWYCVPTESGERQGIVAFLHGRTGDLIGAAPLPAAQVPQGLEALRRRGTPYEPAGATPGSPAAARRQPAGAGNAASAGSGLRTYAATRIVGNVFWSTEYTSAAQLDDGHHGDEQLLQPVLAAIDAGKALTPAELDGLVGPHRATVEPVGSISSRAGTFRDCRLVTTVINTANAGATWYCDGPGIVRREVPGCGSGSPYGSYWVYELVEWSGADAQDADPTDVDAGTSSSDH